MIKTHTYKNIYKTNESTEYIYVQIKHTYTNNGDREQKHTQEHTDKHAHAERKSVRRNTQVHTRKIHIYT